MPTPDMLRRLFPRGYSSGDVLSRIPGPPRLVEQARFKNLPDNAIWWPRNSAEQTCKIAVEEGWKAVTRDLGVLRRDSLCVFRRPAQGA